jgi:hypothetical protein
MAFDSSVLPTSAVESASRVPAYALVLVNIITFAVTATQGSIGMAIAIGIPVALLTGFVIWIIEVRSRRSVATTSSGQAERLEEVRDLDTPIRCVFENLVGEDDVFVVYSSTQVQEHLNQLEETVRPADDVTFGGVAERRVTTIPDAFGAAKIQNLLSLGGKRERVRSKTSWPGDFNSESWDASLILIGSGRSNRATTQALADFESPYRFSEQFDAIVDVTSPGERWPASQEDLKTVDYGIVVKIKVERQDGTRVYMVIAGVGPFGTLAGCVFLERQIHKIYSEYDTSPFAYLLSIRRDDLSAFTPKVERHCALPIARR